MQANRDWRGVDWLFDPMQPDEFVATYLERRLLHVQRQDARRHQPLFPPEQVEQTLARAGAARGERVRAIIGDTPHAPHGVPDGDLVAWVRGHYRAGATILLSNIGAETPELARLVRALEEFVKGRVNVNAYLSAPGSRGFNAHFDPHDVLVLPVSGRKHWTIWQHYIEAPTAAQRTQVDAARLGPPQQELELAAGDLLYVPRGMVHQARALGEATVHLTFGLFFPTWHEVLEECLASASHQLVGLRRSLAACPRPEPEIEPLVAAFGERAVSEAFDRVRARFVQQLQPLPRALSAPAAGERALRIDDKLERVPGMIAHVSEDASGVRIAFPRISDADYAFELAQPAFMADALRFVGAARGPFAVRDIPGEIDDERRLRFVAQLLRAGLLQRAAGEAVSDDK